MKSHIVTPFLILFLLLVGKGKKTQKSLVKRLFQFQNNQTIKYNATLFLSYILYKQFYTCVFIRVLTTQSGLVMRTLMTPATDPITRLAIFWGEREKKTQ